MSQEKIPEKVQEAIFNKLLGRAADAECADCRNKAPTWVSLDFGVFVCIRCSGVHRQLGPHITRVRSTRLDGWTKDNIEIMEAVGNKLANDFYEYRMPSGYRKPNANSTPEECRRFVDEKYIRKGFAPPGHQEPVKEFLACRKKGVNPEFGFSRGSNQQAQEKHQDTKVMRKKSMSLERLPETHHEKKVQQQPPKQNQQQQQQHANHHVDFLTADDDLLGGGSHDDFGDFKQATQSASPIKKQDHFNINANNGQEIQQQQQQNQNQWNWNFNAGQNQGQNNNQSPPQNMQQQQQNPQNVQNTQQQPAENKVDFMKLYNQPQMNQMQGHQNHFMQMQQGGMQGGGWNAHHNNGWHSAGHYGTQQQQSQFQQGGFQQQQGFQNNMNMGGFNNNAGFNQQNMGYGMGGMGMQQQNMGYGYGQQQGQFNNNMMQNQQGFAQMSGNRFF